jgi:hypothetical protein
MRFRNPLARFAPILGVVSLGFFTAPVAAASSQQEIVWNAEPGALAIVANLWPDEAVMDAAVLDLDRDGVGEILIRFRDRCVPPQFEQDTYNCAYGLVRHDGLEWRQIEQAPARDVSLFVDDAGRQALAFDGIAVVLVDGVTKVVPDFPFPTD